LVAGGGQVVVAAVLEDVLRATRAARLFVGGGSLPSLTKCPLQTSAARTATESAAATSTANRMSCQRWRITPKFGRRATDSC
jgi:hypothetical protein